jgi:hypothetical protein
MHPDSIQLETLRQKLEDAEFEAGDKTDYLSYGKPNAAETKKTQELIAQLNAKVKTYQEELKQLIASTRAQNPQAMDEWVDYHIGLLQKIAGETKTGTMEVVRRNVAKGTIQEWEKVRAGDQTFVRINWNYLKDYKAEVRSITPGAS